MKKTGLLLFLISLAHPALGIKPASNTEHAHIQVLIDQANEINKTSLSNPNVRDIVNVNADLTSEEGKPEYLQNRAIIARLKSELKGLKTKRDKIYQQAIRETLLAYDLVPLDQKGHPVMPTKPAVHRLVAGRQVQWIVVYKDDEERVLLDKSGEARNIPAGQKSAGGLTGIDGVTTMYGRFHSPADLALLLYHEQVHYEQFTTPGVGDKLAYNEREEKAYQSEYDKLGEFGLTPNELKTFQVFLAGDKTNPAVPGKIKEHHDKARIERFKLTVSLGYWGGGEPASVKPRPRGEYAAIVEESKDFNSQLAKAAQIAKELAAKETRRQEQIARRDHDERLKNTYAELARRSCASPGSVAQAELDALPKSFGTEAMRTMPPGLDECSGPLYSMLFYGSTADQLRARSEPKSPAPLTRDSTPTQGPPAIPSGPEPIRGRSVGSFATLLPLARDLAVTACGSPDRVAIDPALTIRRSNIDFHPRNDDRLVDEFSRDLGECESRLFRRLVEVIRNGEGPGISVRWVQETAAAYRPAPVYYPPPSGRRCEDYGNIRCPH